MRVETVQMIEEKSRFIRGVETLLSMDKRNMVDSLVYRLQTHDDSGECYDEYIDIIYTNRTTRRLLVTGNNNGANLKQIAKEVY